jgi:hypothetical protein
MPVKRAAARVAGMRRTTRPATPAILCALVGLLLVPTTATAAPGSSAQGGGRTFSDATMTVNPDQLSATGSVRCPDGSLAVGGGLGFTELPGLVLSESGPTPTGDGWRVRVYNPQHVQSDLRVVANCDFGARDYQIVEAAPTPVGPDQYKMAVAACADGRHAVGGGWRVDAREAAGSQSLPYPRDPGTSWLTVVRNFGAGTTNVTSIAVCARVDDYQQAFGARVLVSRGDTGGTVANCPDGLRPAGGGFHADTLPMMAVSLFGNEYGWYALVRSDDPAPRQLYSVAVCTS